MHSFKEGFVAGIAAVVIGSALGVAPSAVAAPTPEVFAGFGGSSDLQPVNGNRIESRIRVDTTNWDSRLEYDSFPNNGDNTDQFSNNINFFQDESFDFSLSYATGTGLVTWSVTGPTDNTPPTQTSTLTLPAGPAGFGNVNVIELFTVGSRGAVTLTNLAVDGTSVTGVDIDTVPTGPTFKQTFLFFGNDTNLLDADFAITGTITFGVFTKNNPSEGSKLTVKLREGVVPEPAPLRCSPSARSRCSAGAAEPVAARRRRARRTTARPRSPMHQPATL